MFHPPKSSTSKSPVKTVVSSQTHLGLCKFPHRKCSLQCLEKYDYCLKHILEDKNAPYKPCPFLYTSCGKRCGKPTHCPDRKESWFCTEHSRKAQAAREKASAKHAPPRTVETLLASLGHYAPEAEEGGETSAKIPRPSYVNPFVEVNAAEVNARVGTQVLEYASDSGADGESDAEAARLDGVWRAQDVESSDAESVDSQDNDPLKHAGVYTAEEVTTITKDKMMRLQSLYIDQLRRLQHLLRERRRKYLHDVKKEKETLCKIHDQDKNNPKELKMYKKLKALNGYHKYHGEEAVLHRKALDRRAAITEMKLPRPYNKGTCIFTEGGVKCGTKSIPSSRFCRKHIMEDAHQVLFRTCGATRGDHSHSCHEPILNVFENASCVYHTPLPPPQPYAGAPPQPQQSEPHEENPTTEEESEREDKKLPDEDAAILTKILSGDPTNILTEEATKILTEEAKKLALSDAADILTADMNNMIAEEATDMLTEEGSNMLTDEPSNVFAKDAADISTDTASDAPEETGFSVEETGFAVEETGFAAEELTNALERLAEAADRTSPLPLRPKNEPEACSIEELIPACTIVKPSPTKPVDTNVDDSLPVKEEPMEISVGEETLRGEEGVVMVDMMSDVGVVEEVLLSEEGNPTDPTESGMVTDSVDDT